MLHDILECSWQSSVECAGVLARRPMKERAYPTSVVHLRLRHHMGLSLSFIFTEELIVINMTSCSTTRLIYEFAIGFALRGYPSLVDHVIAKDIDGYT